MTDEMKSLAIGDTKYLSDEVTTLAICWKLRLRSGKVLGFTNHDEDIVFNDLLYIAKSGFSASAISSNSELTVDNMDIEGLIDNELICERDLLSGLYDNAEIEVFLVNYLNPHDGVLRLRKGWLGEVKFNTDHFITEVRGLLQAFIAKIGETYSPLCRAKFCDERCKMKVEKFSIKNLRVSDVIDSSTFLFTESNDAGELGVADDGDNSAHSKERVGKSDSLNVKEIPDKEKKAPQGLNFIEHEMFSHGFLTFITGSNAGISIEIKYCKDYQINTVLSLPYKVEIGDMFDMVAGCNKTFNMCCKLYNNAINFRGEPHVPSTTRVLQAMR